MCFSSHLLENQYFSSRKIDKNVVVLATTHNKSGLTRRELPGVVTRNETLSGYRYCIFTSLWSCPRLLLSICCCVLNFHLKKNQQFKSKDPFAQFSEKNGRKCVDFCGLLFTPFWAINNIKIIFRTVRCTFRKHAFATLFPEIVALYLSFILLAILFALNDARDIPV